MSDFNPLQTLRSHTQQFRLIAFFISSFSMLFLAFMLFIAQQRTPQPDLISLQYIGIVIAGIQLPLSFYIWKYMPSRMPGPINERILIPGFRITMLIALLLCLGIVLFAGLSAIVTGYPYFSAIIGGAALGLMIFHFPGEKRYHDFLHHLRS